MVYHRLNHYVLVVGSLVLSQFCVLAVAGVYVPWQRWSAYYEEGGFQVFK